MAIYIKSFEPASEGEETGFLMGQKRTCYSGYYPFRIFPEKELPKIGFSPVTVFYGENGSGKSTLLNIIAEKAGIKRHSPFSGGAFFGDYLRFCKIFPDSDIPENSQILSSDDVFDYLINVRCVNNGIDKRRLELFDEFTDKKYSDYRFRGMADYDEWKEVCDAKQGSQSGFVKKRLMKNVDMASNGESAVRFFVDRITSDALYILDEPENSLSFPHQLELMKYIEDSARFYGCQFIIASHSPVFLSIPGAKIYDLDSRPVETKKWTELPNVRLFHDFFMERQKEFEK